MAEETGQKTAIVVGMHIQFSMLSTFMHIAYCVSQVLESEGSEPRPDLQKLASKLMCTKKMISQVDDAH
jgi:hypothetical protein